MQGAAEALEEFQQTAATSATADDGSTRGFYASVRGRCLAKAQGVSGAAAMKTREMP